MQETKETMLEMFKGYIGYSDEEYKKIWKEAKECGERRYLRCLIFNFNSKTYLLDSDEKILREVDKEKLDKKHFIFNPEENQYDYYGG